MKLTQNKLTQNKLTQNKMKLITSVRIFSELVNMMSCFVIHSAELNANMYKCHFAEQFNPSAFSPLRNWLQCIHFSPNILAVHTYIYTAAE